VLSQVLQVACFSELSAEAILVWDLQRDAGPVVTDGGEVRSKDVALWQASDNVWECCVCS
jgi:hypothetical protein